MKARYAIVLLLLAGCGPRRGGGGPTPIGDPFPGSEGDGNALLLRDLEAEVRDDYEHTTVTLDGAAPGIDRRVGMVHIGVGPDDVVAVAGTAVATANRWPLAMPGEVISKRLELHLAEDAAVGWVSDEVSWRVAVCGRTAVIPLRVTAAYVREAERWVLLAEHIGYAHEVGVLEQPAVRPLNAHVAPGPVAINARDLVAAAMAAAPERRAQIFATGDDALALWPGPDGERRGAAIVETSMLEILGADALELSDYRAASSPTGTAAWVAADFTAAWVDGRQRRLRGTFVLELGSDGWRIVQSHVSEPIDAAALTEQVFGSQPLCTRPDGLLAPVCEGAPVRLDPVSEVPVRAWPPPACATTAAGVLAP